VKGSSAFLPGPSVVLACRHSALGGEFEHISVKSPTREAARVSLAPEETPQEPHRSPTSATERKKVFLSG
jgi:hypothetical protein